MADYNLGTAKGTIEIDSSGVATGVASANASLGALDTQSGKTGRGLTVLGAGMVTVGALALGGFGVAVKAAADFEKSMSGVEAVSGATKKEMEQLRRKALQLGKDTSFSAGESALAMEELVKAGLSVEDVLNGAADATVALAAAGEIDLPTAAAIAANAMNQFGLSAQEMPRVADLIAGAANASAIDVHDFGMSLAQAGATANLIGLSFDDLALAITAMGNAGIKGSDAGTSLKTFMTGLQPVTQRQIDLFRDLGLTQDSLVTSSNTMGNAFFTNEGGIKSMSEISGTLATALAGMSDAQKTATLEALFGSDAIRAAAIIAETGAEGFDTLAESMGKVTAAEVAETRMDNLAGAVERLKGSAETLLILIGTPFLDMLAGWADKAAELINRISELDEKYLKWIGTGLAVGGMLLLISGSMLMMIRLLGPLTQGVMLVTGAIKLLTAALLLNPYVLLAAAIAAIGFAIYKFYTSNEGFRKFVDNIIDAVITFGKAMQRWFMEVALPALQDFWSGVQPILAAIGSFFTDTILPAIQAFVDFITNDLVPGITAGFTAVRDAIQPTITWLEENVFATLFEVGNAFFVAILRIIDGIQILSGIISQVFGPVFEGAWNAIQIVVETALEVISTIISTFIDVVSTAWSLFGDNIVDAFTIAWNLIKGIVETVLGFIRGIAQVFTGLFTGDMDKFLEGIRTLWDTQWNAVKLIFETVWNTIKLIVETFIDQINLIIQGGLDIIRGVIDGALSLIQGAWDLAWNAVKTVLETIWNQLEAIVSVPLGAIQTTIQTAIDTISNIWGGLWAGVQFVVQWAMGVVTSVIETFKGWVGGAFDAIKSAITNPINGISGVIGAITSAVNGAIGAIKSLIDWVKKIPSPASIADRFTPWEGLVPGATGGIFFRPTGMLIAEAGAEALIPLTDQARALSLLRQSGLDALVMNNAMGGGGSTSSVNSQTNVTHGPGILVQEMNVFDGVDLDMLMMQAEAQLIGRSL